MNLRELDFPVRVYWDLNYGEHNKTVDCLRICEDILEIRVLSLSLYEAGFPLSPSCLRILERLRDENIAVSLTIPNSSLNTPTIELLIDLNVKTLFVEVSSLNELIASLCLPFIKGVSADFLGISFNVNRDNYHEIPDVLSYCIDNKITCLAFPMQRLISEMDCFYINKKDREELALRVKKINHENIKLIIHDPFLWRVFYPSIDFPGGGCQAANSMVYISPDGAVYPCPSMLVKLGDLKTQNLKEIILSPLKKELRKSLGIPPDECIGCKELKQCMGGCRGRAYVVNGSVNRSDPACM